MGRHVVILAGGSGTRLWPRSREKSPKHLLALAGRLSLLQSTFERVRRLTGNVYVVTERSQVESIREQLPDLDGEHFIIEPARRGTASALGLAALAIAERDPAATMLSVRLTNCTVKRPAPAPISTTRFNSWGSHSRIPG